MRRSTSSIAAGRLARIYDQDDIEAALEGDRGVARATDHSGSRLSSRRAQCLYVALISPSVLRLLESRMTTHIVILSRPRTRRVPVRRGSSDLRRPGQPKMECGRNPGLIATLFTAAFWMLPRALDKSLRHPSMEIGKLISIPVAGRLFCWQ